MPTSVLTLGFLAGGTIFLGLPIAWLRRVSPKTKGFLNAISTGVLIFLLVEMAGHLLETIEELVQGAIGRHIPPTDALRLGGCSRWGFPSVSWGWFPSSAAFSAPRRTASRRERGPSNWR